MQVFFFLFYIEHGGCLENAANANDIRVAFNEAFRYVGTWKCRDGRIWVI